MGNIPNCKIEVYDTTDTLDQTITTDIEQCTFTDTCTTGVGVLAFKLSSLKGLSNIYADIGNNYKCKLFYGYDGTYTHLFTGKITDFTSQVTPECTRSFEGKGLGEILERNFKRDKRWQNVAASDIAQEVADDLGLDSDIDEDLTEETLTVNTESYFDLLRKISDYWYDASTKVTKDFGVNKDGELFWKARPLRTSGVETITNILNYTLKNAILASKNKITVLGAATAPYPVVEDSWTESLDNWAAGSGNLTLLGFPKKGSYKISCAMIDGNCDFTFTLPKTVNTRGINRLRFWYYLEHATNPHVNINAPDESNCFFMPLTIPSPDGTWVWFDKTIGDGNEYDADKNPDGWQKTGSPNWYNITSIRWGNDSTAFPIGNRIVIDDLSFYPERWQHNAPAEDATNQAVYGVREAEYTDDTLNSAAECQQKQETLLYQQKDRIQRLDFTVHGNTNIRMGDRLSITLPLEGLTASPFDVVSCTHTFNKSPMGYQTTVHAINTANTRRLPPLTPLDSIRLNVKNTRDVISNIYDKIVK